MPVSHNSIMDLINYGDYNNNFENKCPTLTTNSTQSREKAWGM